MMRQILASISFFAVSCIGIQNAMAYPTYIGKGYTSCASCHYSPTGGGLPNAYGYGTLSATFPDVWSARGVEKMREALRKPEVTGFSSETSRPKLQADAGLDVRIMTLVAGGGSGEPEPLTDDHGQTQVVVIPMLIEASGVAAIGSWWVYGSITPRKGSESQRPDSVFSREHWIGRKIGETSMLRLGRLVLPFGIRNADHTQYTRQDFGFDKWDQSYALEWDYGVEKWTVSTAAFAGDLILEPQETQQRGGVASVAYHVPGRGSFGISIMGSMAKYTRNISAALSNRIRFFNKWYAMEEVALKNDWSDRTSSQEVTLASAFRLGVFPVESLDVYAQVENRRVFDSKVLTKYRYQLGAQWHILPWVELIPTVILESFDGSNLFTGLFQFHAVY